MQTLYGLIKIQVRRTRHTCLGNYVSNMPRIFISLLSVKTVQHYYLSRKVQINKTNSLVLRDLHNPSIIGIISWRDKEGRTLSLPSNPPAPRPEKELSGKGREGTTRRTWGDCSPYVHRMMNRMSGMEVGLLYSWLVDWWLLRAGGWGWRALKCLLSDADEVHSGPSDLWFGYLLVTL